MDCQRDTETCNINSCNYDKLDSEKLDCHALQSKAHNDDKIDSNPLRNLDSKSNLDSKQTLDSEVRIYFFAIMP